MQKCKNYINDQWIESSSGEVIEVNDALEENPELVNTSPYEGGWFFKLKVSDENLGSTDSLMTAEEYSSMLDGNS